MAETGALLEIFIHRYPVPSTRTSATFRPIR